MYTCHINNGLNLLHRNLSFSTWKKINKDECDFTHIVSSVATKGREFYGRDSVFCEINDTSEVSTHRMSKTFFPQPITLCEAAHSESRLRGAAELCQLKHELLTPLGMET